MATSKLTIWNKFGRFITPAVVAFFFLPFFGVSCDGLEIVSVSGADMVGGCKPGGMGGGMDDDGGGRHHKKDGPDMTKTKVEPFAIIAMVMALGAAGLAWVRTRKALMAACAVSFAGLAAMIILWVGVTGKMKDAMKELNTATKKLDDGDSGGMRMGGMKHDIDIDAGSRWGFWATCLGFIGVGTLTALALREKPEVAAAAAAPPPPPPPA
jgi:hypothetical protein